MRKTVIASLIVTAALPGAAAALSLNDIRERVQQLVPNFAPMSSVPASSVAPARPRICEMQLSRSLSFGSRGADVRALQEFLITEQKLSGSATGYFGPLTKAALASYQSQAGITSVGRFGPRTRDHVRSICGGGFACTMEYAPVCAQPSNCAPQPDGTELCMKPEPRTYTNRCAANADGATVLYEGQCRSNTIHPANDPQCRSWFDGCNSCSRSEPGGSAMCTLRACREGEMQKSYCTSYFGSENRPPVVSGLSGPTELSVNETGTWTVSASDPENGQLTYAIRWGDEWVRDSTMRPLSSPSISIQQEATFTHSYARPGTYRVQLTVRDSAGAQAQTSITVYVKNVACADVYKPVCGRPPGCANSCPPGAYCTMVCKLHDPVTYGNTCELNNANAEYLYEGQCK